MKSRVVDDTIQKHDDPVCVCDCHTLPTGAVEGFEVLHKTTTYRLKVLFLGEIKHCSSSECLDKHCLSLHSLFSSAHSLIGDTSELTGEVSGVVHFKGFSIL